MRQDSNPQAFDRESSVLSTRPGFRLKSFVFVDEQKIKMFFFLSASTYIFSPPLDALYSLIVGITLEQKNTTLKYYFYFVVAAP